MLGRHVVDHATRDRSLDQADHFTYTVGSRDEVHDRLNGPGFEAAHRSDPNVQRRKPRRLTGSVTISGQLGAGYLQGVRIGSQKRTFGLSFGGPLTIHKGAGSRIG